jgi:deoxyhypusine synthase
MRLAERPKIDLSRIKTYDLADRRSKVNQGCSGRPWQPGGSLTEFLESLPDILAGAELRDVVKALVTASQVGRSVLLGMGAHPLKVGLSPIIIELIRRGLLSGLAMNGAGIIHDSELAMIGQTSEDVAEGIKVGRFGMARQTGELINQAISLGVSDGLGLGQSVGRWLSEGEWEYKNSSILAAAYRAGVPVTVHVAIGTDIIHMHPSTDPAATGIGSHRDFLTFTGLVAEMEGGVYLNLGSAVILPEVFLKALNLARNLGYKVAEITTVDLDFQRHYRPLTNVVQRPMGSGGQGFSLIGHHEILFPLLVAAWLENLE